MESIEEDQIHLKIQLIFMKSFIYKSETQFKKRMHNVTLWQFMDMNKSLQLILYEFITFKFQYFLYQFCVSAFQVSILILKTFSSLKKF